MIKNVAIGTLGTALLGVGAMFLLLSPQAPVVQQAPQDTAIVEETYTPPTVAELLMLVNAERAKVGVDPLIEDTRLNKSAQYKASDMAERNYFAHEDPTTGFRNGLAKERELAPECTTVSENIAKNTELRATAGDIMTAWLNSPPHKAALLDPDRRITGIGISDIGTLYIAQHFC